MAVYHYRSQTKKDYRNYLIGLVLVLATSLSLYGSAKSFNSAGGTEAGRHYVHRRHSIGFMADHFYKEIVGIGPQTLPSTTDSATNANITTTVASQNVNGVNHTGITATYFWAGEGATNDNGHISNAASAWDEQWATHFGGIDDPFSRSGFLPKAFTPKENPFYFALPYNDFTSNDKRKSTATSCPNYSPANTSYSWCKNSWVKISKGGKAVYAQWEDVGPFGEDDSAYVFGGAKPKNTTNSHAGIDLSPAARDYLAMSDVDTVDWQFVTAASVPAGPWKQIITISAGAKYN